MIENKILKLRRAANVTTDDTSEELWCAIIGNNKIINTVLYALTNSKYDIRLIFRKKITIEEKRFYKKFDVIMLKGNQYQMDELIEICKKYGGAHIRIADNYIEKEPNIMLLAGIDDNLRSYVRDLKEEKVDLTILLENETRGFIETELQSEFKIPNYLQTIIKPIFNVSDLVLGNVLISIKNNGEISTAKRLASKNNVYLVELEKLMKTVKKEEEKKKKIAEKEAKNKDEDEESEEITII